MKLRPFSEEAQTLIRILGREELIAYHLSRLQSGKHLSTRPVIITSYAQLDPVESLPLLKNVAIDNDEVIETRVAAIRTLGMLIERHMLPQSREVIHFLTALLDFPEISVRSAAAISLAKLEERSLLSKLRQLYEDGRLEVLAAEAVRNWAVHFDKNFLLPPTDLFFGRGKELQAVHTRLQRDRLLLITGLAGIGKTALAAEFSRRCRDEFKVWISLAPGMSIHEIARELRTQMNLVSDDRRSLDKYDTALEAEAVADSISTHIGRNKLLISIDNIQNASAESEIMTFCFTFLNVSPTASIVLAGSPRPGSLDIISKHIITLGKLREQDSIRLLEALAPEAPPKLINAAAELGQGHPLSLRLIAETIASSASLPSERHLYGRLAGMIEESIKGLTSSELATLELFAHLNSAVTFDDSLTKSLFEDQIVGFSTNITDALVQAGLLYSTEGNLLTMHRPLRIRLQESVDERTRLRISRRLAQYFLDRGDPYRAVIHHERVDPIEAINMLLARLRQLINQGRAQWACSRLERLLRDNSTIERDQAVLRQSLAAIGDLKHITGTLLDAINYYERASRVAESLHRSARSSFANKLGKLYLEIGDRRRALDMHEIAGEYARQDAQADILNRNLTDQARVHASMGNIDVALDVCAAAVHRAQMTSDASGVGYCTANLANIILLRDPARALEPFREALDLTTNSDDLRITADILTDYGGAMADLQETMPDSVEILNNAWAIARTIHDKGIQSRAMLHLGRILARNDKETQAVDHFEHALRLAKYRGDKRLEGVILWNKSVSLDELGRRGDALASAKAALTLLEELGDSTSTRVRETLRRLRM